MHDFGQKHAKELAQLYAPMTSSEERREQAVRGMYTPEEVETLKQGNYPWYTIDEMRPICVDASYDMHNTKFKMSCEDKHHTAVVHYDDDEFGNEIVMEPVFQPKGIRVVTYMSCSELVDAGYQKIKCGLVNMEDVPIVNMILLAYKEEFDRSPSLIEQNKEYYDFFTNWLAVNWYPVYRAYLYKCGLYKPEYTPELIYGRLSKDPS